MKKIKEMLRRIGTAGLAAILLTAQMPVTAFAEEIAQPQEIVVSDEVLPTKVQTDDVLPGESGGGIIEGAASEESGEDIANTSKTGDEAVQAGEAPLIEKDASEEIADEESSDPVEKQEEGADEQKAQESDKKDADADGDKEKKEQTASEEEERPAFSESKSIDGVKITVSADEGVFPEGAVLSVEKVTAAQEKQAEEAVEEKRPDEQNVAVSYTYDIKVLDKDGNEIQPADESKVKVSFAMEEVADSNLETNIYHIKEADSDGSVSGERSGNDKADSEEATEGDGADSDSKVSENTELVAEKLPVETNGDTAIAETDGFSLYTVEFTYNNLQYVMPGDSEVALSEILDKVGLTGEVTEVSFSDSSLFSAEKNDNGEWIVTAHKAFSTEEWMKVTIGGVVYEITVTDETLTSVSYVDENGKVQTAEKVDVVTTAMEGYEYKFVSAYDDGWLYVKNDVTLNGASNNASYPIKLILGDNATLTINGYLGIAYVDLTIYCQSGGTGKLVINANCISNPALFIANSRTLTINGGTVEVKNSHVSGDGFGGNFVMNGGTASFEGGGNGIKTGDTQTVAFNGGSLTAVGGGWGISDGTVTLDYKDRTDQIKVSSYSTYSSSTVTIADGKYFKDDDGNLYRGTLTNEQKTAIAGKTLKPAIFHDISVGSSITGGTITAATSIAPDASSATGGQTVTLTVTPDEGYELDTVTVTKAGGGTVATSGTGNTRTFTMPEEAVTVSAATFTLAPKTGSCGASESDHVTYTLTDTDKDNKYDKLEIAGTGAMADFHANGSNTPWYDHRNNIKTLTIAEGVTRIGNGAFCNVVGITSVTIPASVTGIGDSAFASIEVNDTALTTVSFASGSQCRSIGRSAFDSRGGLTGITLPAALESIGDGVFYMNKALTSIDIPAKVTSIGGVAFYGCGNLATVRIFGSPATIGSWAFYAEGSTANGLTVYAPAVNKTDALESIYEGGLDIGAPQNLVYICTAPEAPTANSLTYNGAEQTVAIAAPANCGYTVTGDKQTNVGSYTATATLNEGASKDIDGHHITRQYVWGDASTLTPATSGQTEAKTYAWSITPKSISGVTVAAIPDQTYAGSAIKPAVTVKDGTKTLILDTDYTVEYSNNTNAASKDDASAPTVTIKGKGNYADTGTLTVKFTIKPRPVAVSGITAEDKVYDGTTAATLNYTGATFIGVIGGDNLTVTATGNFADAKAGNNKTVNITDLTLGGSSASNYVIAAGSQTTTTATISKANIQSGDINAPAAKTGLGYNGSAQALITAGSVTGGIGTMKYYPARVDEPGNPPTAPTDDDLYTTALPKATDAGTYYVWYKVIGDANHNDFVSETTVSVTIAKAEYTGTNTASVTVRSGQTTSGKTVVLPALPEGAGYGAVSVGGTTALIDGAPTVNDTTLTFSTTSQNDQTTATITIPVTGATNYEDYNVVVTVTAKAKDETVVTITGIPPIAIEYGDTIVLSGSVQNSGTNEVWTWTSSDSEVLRITPDGANATIEMMKVGTATITASYESDTTLGEAQSSLTVSPKQLDISWKNTSFTYDGTSHIPTATISGVMSGDTCTVSVTGAQINAGSHTATASLTGTDSGNYALPADKKTCSFAITKATPVISTLPTAGAVSYGQTLNNSTLTGGAATLNGTDVIGNFTWSDTTISPAVSDSNKTEYTVTFTPNDSSNLNTTTCQVKLTVNKADIRVEDITEPMPVTNLTYTGQSLPLISAGSVIGGIGTMQYAFARVEDPGNPPMAPTAETAYTTSIPTATNAGTYYVWYKVKGDGNHNDVAAAGPLTVDIAKADFTNKTVSGNTKYGLSGTIELKEHIAPGGTVGELSITDADKVLEGEPSLNGTVLSYSFKSVSENVGKSATVTIPVNNATNYTDYPITVTLNVINCDHKNTERRDMKEATCVSKGHTGKLCCIDCGAMLDEGEEIPIDPDNHQFDEGKVTTQPTIFKEGVKTFTCIRGCGHSYTVAIPRLEGEEDLSDLVEDTADLSGNEAPKVETVKDASGNEIGQQIVIGGKEVSKTVTDPATGKETVETKVWIGGLQSSYTYTGSSIKPALHVYDGTRKLTAGQDYSISYKNNKDAGKATVTVKFKGNYKGAKSETEDFTITPAVLGQDIIAHETGVAVKKKAQKPVPVLTWEETGKKVNSKYFSITYEPGTVREAGTYTATIKPKNSGGNFTGSTTALIKVADKSKLLSNAKVSFDKKSYPYIGTAITPKYTLTLDGAALTEDRDYRMVSIADNTYPGKAAVIFEAVSTNSAGYVGSKTAVFKISGKKELKEGTAFSFDVAESVTYAKGGAKPEVTVTDKERGVILKEGQDYTLSYAKNKAVTNGSKTGEVRLKGKGNYKGKVTLYFAVTQQSLKAEGIAISAADQFTTRQKLKKPSVTIIDIDGKKLKEGTDYTVGQTDASDSKNTEKQGVVSFTVTGKGNYKDEAIPVTFRYEEQSSNIGKSKAAKKIADQTYTGKAVQLSNTELEGVLSLGGKTLVPGTDFKIISTGYSNNVKKGTARVTVQGINSYAGTKTLTFKIVQGKVDYQGALVGGTWQ